VKKKPKRVRSEEGKKKDKERKKRNHLCVHLAKLCKVDVANKGRSRERSQPPGSKKSPRRTFPEKTKLTTEICSQKS
jgi:hypothetical protein